jgi:hypothetical protein
MMDGAHRFVERQIVATRDRSARFWNYDPSSVTGWNAIPAILAMPPILRHSLPP